MAATAIEAITVKWGSKLRLDHLRKLPPVFTAKGEKELSQNAQKLSQSAENMSQTVAFPVTEDYFGVT